MNPQFPQEKINTQVVKGGNTEAFYAKEGTLNKSKMQVAMHPDISRLVFKFGRYHHTVKYSVFKQGLIRDEEKFKNIPKVNDYGMKLIVKGSEGGSR